ncbi:ABC transporter ATP-binding protein [Spirochaeta africana]|uniref:ABC-type multidrug transport system, ATPase and permease component n=1 Tax=Spirochaeta africana (strain ATCC 700263 / DSM 8902 / Z-7692) TaxID=889378 RepID=H9UL41_SPIAZ|nr:ABC transporter ATP-binding protein [Spirochaeta africana]AFG38234.1 ABC-type multidrug transport system, ATPase and permease component [Spirochaeta africana DSM 8902]
MKHDTLHTGQNRRGIWREILHYTKPYTRRMVLIGVMMVIIALVDGLFPYMTRIAVDSYILPRRADGISGFALQYAALALVQGLNIWVMIRMAGRLEVDLCRDLRQAGFRRLQLLSLSYYDKTPAGWILARLTSDTMRLGETISWGIVDLVWGGAMMIAILGFMLFMHPLLTLVTITVIPPLLLASSWFQRRILAAHRDARRINSEMSAAYNEGITGARTAKTLVREDGSLQEFAAITGRLRSAAVRGSLLSATYLPVVMVLATIGSALAVAFGGNLVLDQAITIGTLIAFLGYTLQFFEPVREIARVLSEFQAAQASAERLVNLINTEPEITDRPEVVARWGDYRSPRQEARIQGRISFDRVSFRYATGEPVLRDFSLEIPAGQSIALVGETGSGKSTIVNLMCRFYEPVAGEIRIDGIEYRDRSQQWLHSQLGYVLQTPQLFSGTIRDNIRFGRLSASDQEIEDAARIVGALPFIQSLSSGMDTVVGEGAAQLSQGQKQLISFARAITADPALLILDEATSSIDTETEVRMQHAVEAVMQGRTSIVIAHRLSTVRNADRILVLEHGRILQDGCHDDLIHQPGLYRALYTRQFLEQPAV